MDGVTGATLTSNGVAAMVKDGLTVYKDFLVLTGCQTNEDEMVAAGSIIAEGEDVECEQTDVEQ